MFVIQAPAYPWSCLSHLFLFKFKLTYGISTPYTSTLFLLKRFFIQEYYLFVGFFVLSEFFFQRQYFFQEISRFSQIQGHFKDRENYFFVFQDTWEPWLFVKLHSCSIFKYFICTSSKLSKACPTFNPNVTMTCLAVIFEQK